VVSSGKLDRKLRFANATKSTQDMYPLSSMLSMPGYTFHLVYLRWPINKVAYSWNTLKAKGYSILSKVYTAFSYSTRHLYSTSD
jgi:hypothetical protein